MTFDSSAVFSRTPAGDSELSLPALGLSLGQRRVLTLLQKPSAVDDLAQKFNLEAVKLERDLARLADLHLVELQGAAVAPRQVPAPAATPAKVSMNPVVIGGSTRRAPVKALAAGAVALLLAAGIWYGTRSGDPSTRAVPAAVIATLSPNANAPTSMSTETQGAPNVPARIANESTSTSGVAGTATVLRGNAPPPERRVEIRPGLATLAATVPSPAPAPVVVPVSTPAVAPTTPVARQPVPSKPDIAPASIAPAPASSPVAAAPIEPPAPVQLAAANPSSVPRAAAPAPAPAPLRVISREQPEFPKEAASDGLRNGTVTARLHVDARGKVSGVDIINSQPPRVFDRAVRRALLQWQFEPPASGGNADVDVDIKFQRD